jgi:hypothetical protein
LILSHVGSFCPLLFIEYSKEKVDPAYLAVCFLYDKNKQNLKTTDCEGQQYALISGSFPVVVRFDPDVRPSVLKEILTKSFDFSKL